METEKSDACACVEESTGGRGGRGLNVIRVQIYACVLHPYRASAEFVQIVIVPVGRLGDIGFIAVSKAYVPPQGKALEESEG